MSYHVSDTTIAAMQMHGGPQARALAALWMATPDPMEQAVIMDNWHNVFDAFFNVSRFLEWKDAQG